MSMWPSRLNRCSPFPARALATTTRSVSAATGVVEGAGQWDRQSHHQHHVAGVFHLRSPVRWSSVPSSPFWIQTSATPAKPCVGRGHSSVKAK